MCWGTNPRSRSTPVVSVARIDRRAMSAVTSPAESVATAPMASRVVSIGNVNVIAAATLAYAGQDRRRIRPAIVATATNTTSPATTPRIAFSISFPSEACNLGRVVAAGLGEFGHGAGRQVSRCSTGESGHVRRQVRLIEEAGLGGQRSRGPAGRVLEPAQRFLKPDDAREALCPVPHPRPHQPVQVSCTYHTTGSDLRAPQTPPCALDFANGRGHDAMDVSVLKPADEKAHGGVCGSLRSLPVVWSVHDT